jgi:hypothetical protein
MSYLELHKSRLDNIKTKMDTLNFPDLIRQLRESLGFSRVFLAKDCGMDWQRIYVIERGNFSIPLKPFVVHSLAYYFDINKKFLINKMTDYINEKKYEKTMEKQSNKKFITKKLKAKR